MVSHMPRHAAARRRRGVGPAARNRLAVALASLLVLALSGCVAPKGSSADPFVTSVSHSGDDGPGATAAPRPPGSPPPTTTTTTATSETSETTPAPTSTSTPTTTTVTVTSTATSPPTTTTDPATSTSETTSTTDETTSNDSTTTTSETTTSETTTSETSTTQTSTTDTTTSATTSETSTSGAEESPPVPSLSGGPASGPAPHTATFTMDATDADGDDLAWAFYPEGFAGPVVRGDQGDLPATIQHTYEDPGSYTATFTVSDDTYSSSATLDVLVE